MNNWEGIRNTRFVRSLCKEVDALGPLVRLLKHWAKRRGIAERYDGGFSTYTLVLPFLHHFQANESCNEHCNQVNELRRNYPLLVTIPPTDAQTFLHAVVAAPQNISAFQSPALLGEIVTQTC